MSQVSVSVNEVWSTIWVNMQVKVWSFIYAKSRSAYFPYSSWVLNPLGLYEVDSLIWVSVDMIIPLLIW